MKARQVKGRKNANADPTKPFHTQRNKNSHNGNNGNIGNNNNNNSLERMNKEEDFDKFEDFDDESSPGASPGVQPSRACRKLSTASALLDRGNKGYLDPVEMAARKYDVNGDGYFSRDEVFRIVEDLQKSGRKKRSLKRYLMLSTLVMLILLFSVFGLMWAVVVLTRRVTTSQDGALVSVASGRVVATIARGSTWTIHVLDPQRNRDNNINRRHLSKALSFDQEALLAEMSMTQAEGLKTAIDNNEAIQFDFVYSNSDGTSHTVSVDMVTTAASHDIDSDQDVWYVRGFHAQTGPEAEPRNAASEYTVICPQSSSAEIVSWLTDDTQCGIFYWYVPYAVVAATQTTAVIGYRHYAEEHISLIYTNDFALDTSQWTTVENLDSSGNLVTSTASDDFAVSFLIENLQPNHVYYYRIKVGTEIADPGVTQSFTTMPLPGGTLSFTVFSDAANHYNDRTAPAYRNGGFRGEEPLFAMQIGDFDHSDPETEEEMWQMHRYMRAPHLWHGYQLGRNILTTMAFHHIWDDHDYCGQDTDRSCLLRAEAIKGFRLYYPRDDYPPESDGNYYKFTAGDAEVFVLDTRTNRDPDFLPNRNWKTMLGETQKQWLKDGLTRSSSAWKIVVSTVTANIQARPANRDHWMSGFQHEAAEMKEFIASNSALHSSIMMITADLHTGGAIDDGCHNGWGIPELNVPHTNLAGGNVEFTGDWTEGVTPGTSRTSGFGKVTVEPTKLTMETYSRLGELVHTFSLPNSISTGCEQAFVEPDGGLETCSDDPVRFQPLPSKDENGCIDFGAADTTVSPPFHNANGDVVANEVKYYRCDTSGIKIMQSNGIPDHEALTTNLDRTACVRHWHFESALNPFLPTYDSVTLETNGFKLEPSFLVGFSLSGVALFNALENGSSNAVEPAPDATIQGANVWHGHATGDDVWHYHSPKIGATQDGVRFEAIDSGYSENFPLGFAMDGFPIYGPFDENDPEWDNVDECNFYNVAGKTPRYIVRPPSMVDDSAPFCASDIDNESTNWNYIVGCFRGDMHQTKVLDSTVAKIPGDCVEVPYAEFAPALVLG